MQPTKDELIKAREFTQALKIKTQEGLEDIEADEFEFDDDYKKVISDYMSEIKSCDVILKVLDAQIAACDAPMIELPPLYVIEKMVDAYEDERARYVGGKVYYPNNTTAFNGAMLKAFEIANADLMGVE